MEYKDSYLSLITSEHSVRPKFMKTVSALLQPLQDIFKIAAEIPPAYSIDAAVGKQLDIIGARVGALRTVATEGGAYVLSDSDFRIYIKSKVAQNAWTGGIDDLQDMWLDVFGTEIGIVDNQDMSIDVYIVGAVSAGLSALIKAGLIIPKPAGVKINIYYFSDGKLFGYGMNNELVTGYGGYWRYTAQAPAFTYDIEEQEGRRAGYGVGVWSDEV